MTDHPTVCAQCGRDYQQTPDGIRRHQRLSDPPHRPAPERARLTGQWQAAIKRAERRTR